ncbi:MAG: TlpA family protein disulfide reductase [Candidatus Synoicihabitans palmerolidicus]|nr:TlpA family protein disulfide reductase [Candidatus Synoicihabitans palmerolidicus]
MVVRNIYLTLLAGTSLGMVMGCSRSEMAAQPAAETTEGSVAQADTMSLPLLGEAPGWKLARLDGSIMNSDELKGKIVVLDFWATWCPPCRAEIPDYVEMQREMETDGVGFVGVSLDQAGPSVVKQFSERYEINYPLVMGDQEIMNAYGGIEAIPTTFLIDRDGQIRHRKVGASTRADYEPLVRSLL